MRPEFEKQDKLNLMEDFAAARLMPRGAEANLDALTSAIEGRVSREPTRGLDLPAKRDMWRLLRRLAATENVTTFLSSHDAQEIRSLCSEINVIARGRLVHTGATRELGGDIDAFEERLVGMLTQSEPSERAGLPFRE